MYSRLGIGNRLVVPDSESVSVQWLRCGDLSPDGDQLGGHLSALTDTALLHTISTCLVAEYKILDPGLRWTLLIVALCLQSFGRNTSFQFQSISCEDYDNITISKLPKEIIVLNNFRISLLD